VGGNSMPRVPVE